MKIILFCLIMLSPSILLAQTDTLRSGVYNLRIANTPKAEGKESRQILKGSTRDLSNLKIHTSTLGPGLTNHPPVAYKDREELILITEGHLQVTINATSKILGPGGLALIVAGDEQSFKNTSDKPATYYVLAFQSKNGVNIERGKQGGGSFMKDWGELEVKKTDKGESRPIFDRPSSMFERFDVHATALNPGFASHLPHTHRAEEIIFMIKGNGEMQIGQEFHKGTVGDVIFLGSQVSHAFKNTGAEQCGYYAIQWHNLKGD